MIASSDPIADMLSRIRNAIAVGKTEVSMPHSRVKQAVAEVLAASQFVAGVSTGEVDGHKTLTISLAREGQNSPLNHIARISKPGRRTYVQAKEIPTVKRGRGIVILSTSAGIISGDDAKTKKLGGELICEVF